ncbi:hypothetical protein HDU76_008998, partial [Blyttiomyces sp. JEL0837]
MFSVTDRRAILNAANFLLKDDSDREELVARLSGRSQLPNSNTEVISLATPTIAPTASSSTISTANYHLDHPMSLVSESSSADEPTATIHDMANFLLRNDTDREELVNVLRKAAGYVQSFGMTSSSTTTSDEAAAVTANTVSFDAGKEGYVPSSTTTKGAYGLDAQDVFNQLVMLETPALSTAPILSKL